MVETQLDFRTLNRILDAYDSSRSLTADQISTRNGLVDSAWAVYEMKCAVKNAGKPRKTISSGNSGPSESYLDRNRMQIPAK